MTGWCSRCQAELDEETGYRDGKNSKRLRCRACRNQTRYGYKRIAAGFFARVPPPLDHSICDPSGTMCPECSALMTDILIGGDRDSGYFIEQATRLVSR